MTIVDGYLWGINGKIVPSIVSNGLKVEIKNFDGTDFSASVPLVHKIDYTPRTLTGALSLTVPGGTGNFFNAGAVEFATLGVDYFVYLGWRAASSTVFILISRIPYGRTYADFSATTTNEKYGAYSGSAPASTDAVENIGRIRAINSGTALYNWTLPATQVNVQHPIYETDWLTYTGQVSASTGTITTVGTVSTTYQVHNQTFNYRHDVTITTNGTGAGYLKVTLPFTPTSLQVGKGISATTGYILSSQYLTNFAYWDKYDHTYPAGDGHHIFGSGENVRLA